MRILKAEQNIRRIPAAGLIAVRFAYLQYNILEMSYKNNSRLYVVRKVLYAVR